MRNQSRADRKRLDVGRRDVGLRENVTGRKHVVVVAHRFHGIEDVYDLFVSMLKARLRFPRSHFGLERVLVIIGFRGRRSRGWSIRRLATTSQAKPGRTRALALGDSWSPSNRGRGRRLAGALHEKWKERLLLRPAWAM